MYIKEQTKESLSVIESCRSQIYKKKQSWHMLVGKS